MGHIDHGKSTLLDYIRKTNIVDSEVGGITQSISAYEVVHKDEKGENRKITFLDTPGHEAFSKMRERGAEVADIAILVVSAVEGVEPQTIEAWKTIEESQTHPIVAINKIDKPGANVEKTKMELAEAGIYLENYGGKVPVAEISAKTGQGIDNLLSLILLLAEIENLEGDREKDASGFVIEANLDARRGIMASLVIKDGTLKKGMTVAAEDAISSTRLMEDFMGRSLGEASFSSPVRIYGFDELPRVGAEWKSFKKKSEALEYGQNWAREAEKNNSKEGESAAETDKKIIPILLKADLAGSLEAIEKEIAKIKSSSAEFKIIGRGVGAISESDIKSIGGAGETIAVGFRVKADKSAEESAQKRGITISFFDIIYKLAEWLEAEMERRRPRVETVETTGRAKILRAFSRTKERQILGGRVEGGVIVGGGIVKIMRREFEIGRGKIINLEKGKVKVSEVPEGSEFGMMIESKIEIVLGDFLELFSVSQK